MKRAPFGLLGSRSFALAEVTGVFVAGHSLASILATKLPLSPLGPEFERVLGAGEADLSSLSWSLFQVLALQYSCLFFFAAAITWSRRGKLSLRGWGFSAAGQPLARLAAWGLLGFCLVALPFKLLWVAQQHIHLGEGSVWWVLLDRDWNPTFWLLFAVGSFGFVPIIEEAFFRGYCQTRLEEDFGGVGGLLIAALFFVSTHGQYHNASVLSVATIACLIPAALGMGYLYLKTRSLLPGIVLHGALNLPTKGNWDIIVPSLMVVILVAFWSRWVDGLGDFCRGVRAIKLGAITVASIVSIVVAVGFQVFPGLLVPLSLGALLSVLLIRVRRPKPGV